MRPHDANRRPRGARRGRPLEAGPVAGPRVWLLALALVLAGAAVYSNSLSGPFLFDDQLSIIENGQIRRLFSPAVLFAEREAPVAGRPLVNISFAINYAIGGLDVVGYHVGNVAIHLLCALVLFGIVRRTIELPGTWPQLRGWSAPLAFASALIWVVHPLNTEAVDYLTERTESMMGLFYFLTLYAGIRARVSSRAAMWTAAAVLSCAAGMACKESMATAPLMVALYDRVFLFGSLREAWRSRWRLYAGLAATWVELAALLSTGPRVHSAGFGTVVPPWTYLLNQAGMIVRYLELAVWPHALVLNYGPARALTLADAAPYALVVAALLALTAVCLAARPRVGFLGAFFFVTLAPASSIVPVATEVGAERRMYVPLAALAVLAVIGGALLWRRLQERGSTASTAGDPRASSVPLGAAALLAVLALALGLRTMARNEEYASRVSIARTVLDRWPTSTAHLMLGTELVVAGQKEEALGHLREAARGEPKARYNLGVELFREGKLDEAVEQLRAFVTSEPLLLEVVPARIAMGRIFAKEKKWAEAVAEYRLVLKMAPSNLEARGLLADALLAQESFDEAVQQYQEYFRSRPTDGEIWTNLGIAYASTGNAAQAVQAFRRAQALRPGNPDAHRNLANALLDMSAFGEAASHAEEAIRIAPADAIAHELLGLALAGQAKFDRARAELERALELAPADQNIRDELNRLTKAPGPTPARPGPP